MNSILSHGKMSTELPSKVPGTGLLVRTVCGVHSSFAPKNTFMSSGFWRLV